MLVQITALPGFWLFVSNHVDGKSNQLDIPFWHLKAYNHPQFALVTIRAMDKQTVLAMR